MAKGSVPISIAVSVGGDRIDLSMGRFLLVFSMVNCSPCRAAYSAISESGVPKGWDALLVVEGEQTAVSAEEKPSFPHRSAVDAESRQILLREFGVDQFPYFYVSDQGKIRYAGNDWSAARQAMQ